jgi:hypothetical protein
MPHGMHRVTTPFGVKRGPRLAFTGFHVSGRRQETLDHVLDQSTAGTFRLKETRRFLSVLRRMRGLPRLLNGLNFTMWTASPHCGCCGLASSTVLNMLAFPTKYARFGVQRLYPELSIENPRR